MPKVTTKTGSIGGSPYKVQKSQYGTQTTINRGGKKYVKSTYSGDGSKEKYVVSSSVDMNGFYHDKFKPIDKMPGHASTKAQRLTRPDGTKVKKGLTAGGRPYQIEKGPSGEKTTRVYTGTDNSYVKKTAGGKSQKFKEGDMTKSQQADPRSNTSKSWIGKITGTAPVQGPVKGLMKASKGGEHASWKEQLLKKKVK